MWQSGKGEEGGRKIPRGNAGNSSPTGRGGKAITTKPCTVPKGQCVAVLVTKTVPNGIISGGISTLNAREKSGKYN